MRPVAVVGSLTTDVVDGGPPRIGGPAYYAATALRLLARPALVVTRCAERDRTTLLPRLVAQGTPVEWLPSNATFRFRHDYDGAERASSIEEAAEPWRPGPWLELLRGAGAVHVGPVGGGEFPPETLAALRRGRRLLLDGQGLTRPAGTGPVRLAAHVDADALRHVGILKLAEEEAVALAGGLDGAALASLGVPEVVVTRGPLGSLVLAGGHVDEVPAVPVDGVDPTGAGDAFAASYLVSRETGLAPAAAARRATAVVAALLDGRRRR